MSVDITKIKKTELCPCGSGKKYRSCCYNAKDKVTIRDDLIDNSKYVENYIRKLVDEIEIKCCLYPRQDECDGVIKKAHTLQNNGILSVLSENGHVMVTEAKADKNGIHIEFVKRGRNEATTFTGFCSKHDTEVFADIEIREYEQLPKQNFLFAYRAFSQEYHKKLRMFRATQNIFKNKPSLTKDEFAIYNYRLRQLEMYDMNLYKEKFDYIILHENYDCINSRIIELEKAYDFAVTTMFVPTRDLNGKELNDAYSLEETRQKACFITIIPSNNRTIIIISWLREDGEVLEEFINQIMSLKESELKCYLNNILPMYTENIILSPRLWDRMPNYCRKKLIEALQNEFPRTDKPIDFMKVIKSKYRYKDDYLEVPEYDLFKV